MKALASKSKTRKGSKKLMEGLLTGFNKKPKLFMCIFLRGSMLPSYSQGVYDIKCVRVTAPHTILKSGPVSFKMTQNTLEIFIDIHHIVTTPQL